MSDFDPYLKWLGIREEKRPINHYRLLGLELFESDPDVIAMAADRQMAHIRTYQNGPHGELSQQILNELARARRCLLVPEQKANYDEDLRLAQQDNGSMATEPVPEVAVAPSVNVSVSADPKARSQARRREKSQMLWGVLSWISGGIAAVGVAAYLIGSGVIPMGGGDQPVAQGDPTSIDDPGLPTTPEKDKPPIDKPPAKPAGNPEIDDPPQVDPETGPLVAPGPAEMTPENEGNRVGPLDDAPPPVVIRGPLMPDSTQWTLGNVGEYPEPSPAVQLLFQQIEAEIKKQRTQRSELSSPVAAQTLFYDLPESARILIGFRIWVNANHEISRLQSIYQTLDGVVAGPGNGRATRDYVDLIADPGFGVASVTASVLSPMNSIQVNFRPLSATGFDEDREGYSSPWVGRREGVIQSISPANDNPIVGYFGGVRVAVQSVGLIAAGAAVGTADTAAMEDPFKPDPEKDTRLKVPTALESQRLLADLDREYRLNLNNSSRPASFAAMSALASRLRSYSERETDPNEKYLLKELAAKYFALTGDASSVVELLKEVNEEYQIDFWPQVQASLGIVVNNVPPNMAISFKTTVDDLIRLAVDQREFTAAFNLIDGAQKLSVGDIALKNWYRQQEDNVREFQRHLEAHEETLEKLAADSSNTRANEEMGDYQFVVEKDVEKALEYWAKSGSSVKQRVAEMEREVSRQDGAAMLKLSEAWERLGKGSQRTLRRIYASRRAYDLYQDTLRLVDESRRSKVEKSLKELKELLDL